MLRSRFYSLSCLTSLSSFTSRLPLLLHTHHLKHHHQHYLTRPISSFSHSLLRSCQEVQTLRQLHASLIVSAGFEPVFIASKLIALYTQFDDLESAVLVFNVLGEPPHTVIWNSVIKAQIDLGFFDLAFLLYRQMRELSVEHDGFTFPIINRAISSLQSDVSIGEMVHCVAIQMGFGWDIYFCNTMIEVYVKCGSIDNARMLFDEMPHRDLVSWTSMISGYVCVGSVISALKLFNEMRMELEPNSVTVIVMLQACSIFGSVIEGRELHGYVIKKGYLIDGSVKNSVCRMYTKTGSVEEVEKFFCEVDKRDVVSWNILLSFYSLSGDISKVAESFNEMQREVIIPSIQTLTLVISAIAKSGCLSQGEMLHCFAIKTGMCDDIFQTSLLDFYAKCWELGASVKLFKEIHCRNSITWSAIISGFIHCGHFKEAIELFQQMQVAGLEPGAEILKSLVVAYTHLGALQLGKGIHGYLIRSLYYSSEEEYLPLKTSILNMYIRCGSISAANNCFNRMVVKDIVTWTTMIEGFGTHGLGFEALKLFDRMVEEGIQPNSVTYLSLLSACSHSGLVCEGCEVIYSMKWRYGIEPDLDHYTCIVDLLGRAGKLKEALAIILKMVVFPDSRIWGALLAACRVYGDRKLGEYVVQRFLELESDNVGYYTLLSNIHAGVQKWAEVEELRRLMSEKDLKKKPGWSCIEAKGRIHGFVSGDRSHHQVGEIYEVLGCLGRKTQDFGYVLHSCS
ncbi:hypothetical protein L1049_007507 [Liquidambar formosana]|uniref:Pentatricopeptide repeat-containing protein n=1 Tax=Liquidambar formosana TaxID=63359 RepID=A0AAP0S805_LIQFO